MRVLPTGSVSPRLDLTEIERDEPTIDARDSLQQDPEPRVRVTEPARPNLSRWRHGFEPRWDYQRERASRRHISLLDVIQAARAPVRWGLPGPETEADDFGCPLWCSPAAWVNARCTLTSRRCPPIGARRVWNRRDVRPGPREWRRGKPGAEPSPGRPPAGTWAEAPRLPLCTGEPRPPPFGPRQPGQRTVSIGPPSR
jgi:hypothetical protein